MPRRPAGSGSRSPTWSSSAGRSRGAGRAERRIQRAGAIHAGTNRRLAGETDVESFAVLEPIADGFRNYFAAGSSDRPSAAGRSGAAPDADRSRDDGARWRVRVLNANAGDRARRLHQAARALTNDFFVNLLDMETEWKTSSEAGHTFEGRDREDGRGQVDRHPRRPHLRFELPASGARRGLRLRRLAAKFVRDFVAAWTKVMNLDRFDLA